MKKIILTLSLLLTIAISNAQSLPDYNSYKLESESDFKAAENAVIRAADYILQTPLENMKPDKSGSMDFLLKWMTGTPDYSFNIEANDAVMGAESELVAINVAAMAKYILENKDKAKDDAAVKLGTWNLVADYVANPANKIEKSDKLKKLVEARKKGTMEKFIKDNPTKY